MKLNSCRTQSSWRRVQSLMILLPCCDEAPNCKLKHQYSQTITYRIHETKCIGGEIHMLSLMPYTNSRRVAPYRLWGFQYSRKYHTWDIGIGSSPVGFEGFVQPRKGQGETKPNSQYNNLVGYPYGCFTSQTLRIDTGRHKKNHADDICCKQLKKTYSKSWCLGLYSVHFSVGCCNSIQNAAKERKKTKRQ